MIPLTKTTYNIMLSFVSLLTRFEETEYRSADDAGTVFWGVQTNEAAIYQMQHTLRGDADGLDKIILMKSVGAGADVSLRDEKQMNAWNAHITGYGCSAMSSIDFLKAQVTAKHPELADKFVKSDFNEDAGIEEEMRYIAALGKLIQHEQEAAEKAGLHEVVLHADMTGGLRHASMMMLAIMQLSKYMGIRIGHVIYAEKKWSEPKGSIQFVDDIHRMFDLIAGADEFQKYGSVQALDEYFGDVAAYSEPFRRLLGAMRSFSDAIRICRTAIIEEELESLGEHIRMFREQTGGPIQEELFRRIVKVLEREYGTVLGSGSAEERRLNIIAWCLRKKFLQQAMTLCTEWIPRIIVEKRICYTEDIAIMRVCRKKAKNGMRSWQQEFIIQYGTTTDAKDDDKVPYGDAGNMFRFILKHDRKDLITELPENMQNVLCSFLRAHSSKLETYADRDISLQPIHTKNRFLRKAIDHFQNQGQKKPFPYRVIPARIGAVSEKIVLEIFELSVTDFDQPTKTPEPQLSMKQQRAKKWAGREKDYRRMFTGKPPAMRSDLPLDQALNYLRGYFDIREERNRSNHAVITAGQESSRLEQDIAAYIEKLRNHPSEPMP